MEVDASESDWKVTPFKLSERVKKLSTRLQTLSHYGKEDLDESGDNPIPVSVSSLFHSKR